MAIALLIAAMVVWVASRPYKLPERLPPPFDLEFEVPCSGCGTVFLCETDEEITECPNCPVSDEELEELIKQLESLRK